MHICQNIKPHRLHCIHPPLWRRNNFKLRVFVDDPEWLNKPHGNSPKSPFIRTINTSVVFSFSNLSENISQLLLFVFCSVRPHSFVIASCHQSRIFLRPLQLQPFSPPPLSATSSALKMFISLSLNISRTDSFFINITPSTD